MTNLTEQNKIDLETERMFQFTQLIDNLYKMKLQAPNESLRDLMVKAMLFTNASNTDQAIKSDYRMLQATNKYLKRR